MKKGFTLIELLVVVLIIGILSSVALPMYRRSVDKARAVEALQMGKAWGNAQRVYKLETGEYSHDLEALSIKIPEMKYFDMDGHYGSYLRLVPIGCNSPSYGHFSFSLDSSGNLYGSCAGGDLCKSVMPCGQISCEM
ncbi:type IV pilin protein [Candidatus Avelusimicrobium sp.]